MLPLWENNKNEIFYLAEQGIKTFNIIIEIYDNLKQKNKIKNLSIVESNFFYLVVEFKKGMHTFNYVLLNKISLSNTSGFNYIVFRY